MFILIKFKRKIMYLGYFNSKLNHKLPPLGSHSFLSVWPLSLSFFPSEILCFNNDLEQN